MAKSPAQASASIVGNAPATDNASPGAVTASASDAGKKGRKAYDSKSAAFKAIATGRVNTAVAAIEALGEMACNRYEYTTEHIEKISGALGAACEKMDNRMRAYLANPASAPAKANKIEL